MNTSAVEILEANGSVYKSVKIEGKKNTYSFMSVTGKSNYVNVYKMNTPWVTPGKDFESFDKAQEAYKIPELKTMILLAETLLK